MIPITDAELRRLVELSEKATAAPWSVAGKSTGYIFGRDNTSSHHDAVVQVAVVGGYRDKELLRFNRERWDADAALLTLARNLAPQLAEEMMMLRKELAAANTAGEVLRDKWSAVYSAYDIQQNELEFLKGEVLALRAALDGLVDVVFAAGLTADNTPVWLKARAALDARDTGPLASCTSDDKGPVRRRGWGGPPCRGGGGDVA